MKWGSQIQTLAFSPTQSLFVPNEYNAMNGSGLRGEG